MMRHYIHLFFMHCVVSSRLVSCRVDIGVKADRI